MNRPGSAAGGREDAAHEAGRLARRGAWNLLVAAGALFAWLDSRHHWLQVPEHRHSKGRWLDPLLPGLAPYLPAIVLLIGATSLVVALLSFHRCAGIEKRGRP